MKVRLLGAHGIDSRDTRFMSVLVDEVIALDAGSLSSMLSFPQQEKVKAVMLTHSHADHIMGLAALCMRAFVSHVTVEVYAIKETIDALKAHVFNDVISPDFTVSPSPESPAVRFHQVEAYQPRRIGDYEVAALPVHHSVPAVGYQVTSASGKSVLYTGDTGPGLAPRWDDIHPDIIICDCAAPNSWDAGALHVGHMTPNLLRPELVEFRRHKGYLPRIIGVHMVPSWQKEIERDVFELAREIEADITLGYEGMEVEI
ncbi:MAG: 3',5'-cyclic-nucleotide phosphodiesterase [Dehalococcoidia bacterium]|nr:3',5'-cyclic-nucleotide phosphodiesterase [Dehalococcoidia bacterium]